MTRKQVLFAAAGLTGLLIVAAGFIPYDKTISMTDVQQACQKQFSTLGEQEVNDCTIRHMVGAIDRQRVRRNEAVEADLR